MTISASFVALNLLRAVVHVHLVAPLQLAILAGKVARAVANEERRRVRNLADAAVEAGSAVGRLAGALWAVAVFARPAARALALVAAERRNAPPVVFARPARDAHVLVLAPVEREELAFGTDALRRVDGIHAADRISWTRLGRAEVDFFLAVLPAKAGQAIAPVFVRLVVAQARAADAVEARRIGARVSDRLLLARVALESLGTDALEGKRGRTRVETLAVVFARVRSANVALIVVFVSGAVLPHDWWNLAVEKSQSFQSAWTGARCFSSFGMFLLYPASEPLKLAVAIKLVVGQRNSCDRVEHVSWERTFGNFLDPVLVQGQHVEFWKAGERVLDQAADSVSSEKQEFQFRKRKSVWRDAADAIRTEVQQFQFFELVKLGQRLNLVVLQKQLLRISRDHLELN